MAETIELDDPVGHPCDYTRHPWELRKVDASGNAARGRVPNEQVRSVLSPYLGGTKNPSYPT